MVRVVEPECFYCTRLTEWPSCRAYPEGIPDSIKDGDLHHAPRDGDRGFQFEPKVDPGTRGGRS